MTFVFRAIAMAAICFSGGIAVAAQPYGPGQPQGPMNGTVPPYVSSVSSPAAQMSAIQSTWNAGAAQVTQMPSGAATYGAPSATYNPVYGQPVLKTFSPTPGEVVESGAAQAAAPMAGGATFQGAIAPANGAHGDWGGVGSNVAPQPIYGPWVQGPAIPAGPVIPVQPATASNCCPKWFGGVYGLIMDRDGEDDFSFFSSAVDPRHRCFNASEADMSSAGGVEARIGKTFCNCRWGLEGVYWGLYPDDEYSVFDVPMPMADPVVTTMDFSDVYLNLEDSMGVPYRDTIQNHFNAGTNNIVAGCLHRSFEYHNIELNILSGPLTPACSGGCGDGCGDGCGGGGYYNDGCYGACYQACEPQPKLNVGWLFGVRYFKMDESVSLLFDAEDGYFYSGDPSMEFAYDVETENNLVGVQLGMHLDYYLTKRLHLEAGSKFGFYGNHMTSSQHISNGYGLGYVTDGSTDTDFNFHASEDDIAYLGELRAGVGYKLSCRFRVVGGYRVVAASGVALPLDQIAYGRQFAAPTVFDNINNNGQLVLHGAYAGLEFAW